MPNILKYFTELPRGALGVIVVSDQFEQKIALDAISVEVSFNTILESNNTVRFSANQTLHIVCPEDCGHMLYAPPIVYDVAWFASDVDIPGFMAREEFYIEDY